MNLSVIKYLIIILFFLLSACETSCQSNDVKYKANERYGQQNDSMIQVVRSGDVILRRGRDEISQIFGRLNMRNQQYTHCGIAQCSDSGVYVYHIISSANNKDGKIIYEPIHSFIHPRANAAWAAVRYDFNASQISDLLNQIRGYDSSNVVFDLQFDLATSDKLYCSEMLYKAFLFVTKDSSMIEPTIANTGKMYIAIDNLYEHKHCKTIGEIAYK